MQRQKFPQLLLLFIMLLVFTAPLRAAEDVAGAWASLTVKKALPHHFGLQLHGEYRATDNFRQTDCFFLRPIISYAPCQYVSMAVAYDFLGSSYPSSATRAAYMRYSHRFILDLQGQYKLNDWTFQLRERYVMSYTMPATVAAAADDGAFIYEPLASGYGHLLRSYPFVSYHIPDSRWTPFLAAEFYNSLNNGDHFRLKTTHLFAGTSIKLDDVNALRIYYVANFRHTAVAPAFKRVHTLGLGYIITLP